MFNFFQVKILMIKISKLVAIILKRTILLIEKLTVSGVELFCVRH